MSVDCYLGLRELARLVRTRGLPVGLQIVGRQRDDFGVLQLAGAFENATGIGKRRPPAPA
jgi:Asp-tRNA(Asn)/Glu-tRNA(Gln) amidotransferase A subunit family amidase